MTMKRRDFLRVAALSYGAVSLPRAGSVWAQTGARSEGTTLPGLPGWNPKGGQGAYRAVGWQDLKPRRCPAVRLIHQI